MKPALVREISGCRDCEAVLDPNPVLQLAPEARILVASQAPGRIAHETGIPFNDASGKRLREWMGIGAQTFYDPCRIAILPMAFCFPGGGRQGDRPPPPQCAARWRRRCLDLLGDVDLVLLIGQYAQAWHLGEAFTTVTDSVAGWRDHAPGMFPLPHPSPRNTPWLKRNPWFEAELLPALRGRITEILYK